MRTYRTLAATVVLVGALAAPASAQVFLGPVLGWTFGGDAENSRFVYGGLVGFGGTVGVDIDFGYAPNFFGGEDRFGVFDSKLNITTLMFNFRVGGGAAGAGLRPYLSGGVGLMRGSVSTAGDLFDDVTRSDFALNAGGGFNGFFNDNVGIRVDVRYFRNLEDEGGDGFLLDPREFDLGTLDYWRGTVGLVFRF